MGYLITPGSFPLLESLTDISNHIFLLAFVQQSYMSVVLVITGFYFCLIDFVFSICDCDL